MIDLYIQKACVDQAKEAHIQELTEAMKMLPISELEKIACGGMSSLCSQDEWIKSFEGTPLFDQALQLAHQLLELDMQRQQLNQQQDMQMDVAQASRRQLNNQTDLLRVQQRTLGLELAQYQQAQSAAVPALPPAQDVPATAEVHPPMLAKAAAAMRASLCKLAGISAPISGAGAGAALGLASTNKDDNVASIAGKTIGGAAVGSGLSMAGHIGLNTYRAHTPGQDFGKSLSDGFHNTMQGYGIDSRSAFKPSAQATPTAPPAQLPMSATPPTQMATHEPIITPPPTKKVPKMERPAQVSAQEIAANRATRRQARAAASTAKATARQAENAAIGHVLAPGMRVAATGVENAAANELKSRIASGVVKLVDRL